MKVYVITKGSYSDYHICAVAIDKEKAEKLEDYYTDKWDEANIEEYDTEASNPFISNFKLYFVCCAENGELTPFLITNPSCIELFGPTIVTKHEHGQYIAYVWAVDEKHAAKIASDKIAEFKYREEDEK